MAWTVDSADTVYVQTSGGAGWQPIPGALARDIAIAPDGSIWIVGFDGLSIHQFKPDGTGWQPEYYLAGMEAASISIDGSGNPWFVAADGQLYSW